MAETPALLFRVCIAGFKDLLSETLETMFVQIVVCGLQLRVAGAVVDEWGICRGPAVEVDGCEMS